MIILPNAWEHAMEDIIILGHKNPDTDSVCSSYCYARLKNRIDTSHRYIAGRCGNMNKQTRFVFNKFNIEPPVFIKDVFPRVKDIMTADVVSIGLDEPVYDVMKNMEELKIRMTPVVDNDRHFRGVISFFEIANFYIGDDISRKPQYLFRANNFQKTLKGNLVKTGDKEEFTAEIVIGAMPFERSISHLEKLLPGNTVLVTGNRTGIIEYAVRSQMPAVIITGVENEKDLDYDFTGYRGWVFLSSMDTAETHRLLMFSTPTKSIMNEQVPGVGERDYVEHTRDLLLQTGYRALPVLRDGKLVGIVTRSDLIKRKKRKLILMDHNEIGQAVDGAESSEIVEIIDHHRLGTIKTQTPIYVYAKPVGSTCTLVYQLYRYHGIAIETDIASLLLAGILSDTAILKSPTTTAEDRNAVNELAAVSGIDYMKFSIEMFSSTDSLGTRKPVDVVTSDFKVYTEYGISAGIGQAEVISLEEIVDAKKPLVDALDTVKKEKELDWAMLLVTDIIHEDSILISTPFPQGEMLLRYNSVDENSYSLPGVLSRKKQLLPEILRVLEEIKDSGSRAGDVKGG